jgi:glycosyltransferase involved in cell wall biosynthesis
MGLDLPDKRIIQHKLFFSAPVGYYLNALQLRRLLLSLQPDLLNTHYASGYGTLARFSGFHPNLLSVWGSDVYDFPYQSRWKLRTLRKNILSADQIASTSNAMKHHTSSISFLSKEIIVTPFGVDCKQFSPLFSKVDIGKLRIGTVKRMTPKYGISYLIQAFAQARQWGLVNAELVLVGGGSQEQELKGLVVNLGLQNFVQFIGPVPHSEVPKWLNSFDIYVTLSESESFGVAVLEASACGIPVIVSDAGGLPEVVVDGQTGFIVPRKDPYAAAERLLCLASDPNLRRVMGQTGRRFVLDTYEWSKCADFMENLYFKVVQENSNIRP